MKLRKINNKGFSHVEMVIVVLVVAVLGLVGWRVLKNTSHAGSNCIGTSYLNVGSRGVCVSDLQNILNAVNPTAQPLIVSGLFDENTQGAVEKFQNTKGLNVSPIGEVESSTWQRLCNTVPVKKTQVVQDAQSDACGKSNFSVVSPKSISSNYQIGSPGGIIKDANGNVLISSILTDNCYSNISVINPNTFGLSKVIKVDGFAVDGMTLDSYGNVWAIGTMLCKGVVGVNPSDWLLKINVASGQVTYKVNINNLPNSGKLALNWGGDLTSDSKGNLYLVGEDSNANENIVRLSATDGSLLENYNFLLPVSKNYWWVDIKVDSKGYIWATTTDTSSNSYSTTYTVIDPLKNVNGQVGAVVDTYNNLPANSGPFPVVDYAHNSVYVPGWNNTVAPLQMDEYQINMTTHNQVALFKNVGGGNLGLSLLDSNNNIWFLNNGSNINKGGPCDSPCTTNPNYIPSSLTFMKGSNNNTQVLNNSSLGLYTPLGAIQVGNNLWVLNLGSYDTTNQVYLPSITIMNVNTQSLVKVLYNHQ